MIGRPLQLLPFATRYHSSPTSNYFTAWNGLSFGEGSQQVAEAPFRVASPDMTTIHKDNAAWHFLSRMIKAAKFSFSSGVSLSKDLLNSFLTFHIVRIHNKESWMIFKYTKYSSPTNEKKKIEGTTKGTTLDVRFPLKLENINHQSSPLGSAPKHQDTESCANANRCCKALLTESLKGRLWMTPMGGAWLQAWGGPGKIALEASCSWGWRFRPKCSSAWKDLDWLFFRSYPLLREKSVFVEASTVIPPGLQ